MRTLRARLAVLTAASLAAAPLVGRSTGSTTAGTSYDWRFNTLEAVLAHPLDAVYEAALAATKRYELTVVEQAKDAFGARIVAEGAKQLKYTFDLLKTGERVAEVKLTVGAFGDEARSREIMNWIEDELD